MIDDAAAGGRLLPAHVAERTGHVAGGGEALATLNRRQPEVCDPQMAALIDQQVARLNVAMNDTDLMGMFQSYRGLLNPLRYSAGICRRVPAQIGWRSDA